MIKLVAFKRLSLAELRQRWEELRTLPTHDKQALQTFLVGGALIVTILVVTLSWGMIVGNLMPMH